MSRLPTCVVAVAAAFALVACGGGSSQHVQYGPGSAAHPAHLPNNTEKLELAGAAVALAVGESAAARALTDACFAACVSPNVCDRKTGLCVSEFAKSNAKAAASAVPRAAPPAAAAPTCDGLCLPNERCVVKDGVQDCVRVGAVADPTDAAGP